MNENEVEAFLPVEFKQEAGGTDVFGVLEAFQRASIMRIRDSWNEMEMVSKPQWSH